jgi:stearoyl-CoA desaturase (delta-9 desaturase)
MMVEKTAPPRKLSHLWLSIVRWFDSYAGLEEMGIYPSTGVDWLRIIPFIVLHGMCLGIIWVGWSWTAVGVAVALYLIRMFAVTGFYHRYFSHNSFRASRGWTLLFALLANSAVQRGPLWWAATHRHHHQKADQPEDVHSPVQHGLLWSHMGWLTSAANFPTRRKYVGDWSKFPELVWIDRFDMLIPVILAIALFLTGKALENFAPGLGTSGAQLLIWGFFVSTVVLFHGTATINSLDHMFGSKRYWTGDESRNNPVLALITLGEGWHNNHHHYPVTARQGFFWWEIDITYYLLWFLERLGIIRDLRPLPEAVRNKDRIDAPAHPPSSGEKA